MTQDIVGVLFLIYGAFVAVSAGSQVSPGEAHTTVIRWRQLVPVPACARATASGAAGSGVGAHAGSGDRGWKVGAWERLKRRRTTTDPWRECFSVAERRAVPAGLHTLVRLVVRRRPGA